MSTNFPNAVYVPTALASKDYIQISGYCYKKVATNQTVTDEIIKTDFITGFTDCLDCNTCRCPKDINFIFGGILHNISLDSYSFSETAFTISTSSTGWQEIALESGYLNKTGDVNYEFKPLSVRCYDRKIDMQSGIYASFDSPTSHTAHFNYVSGDDIYERRDLQNALATGEFGTLPAWDYLTQYDDAISYQNTIRTIKFKSLCEATCNHHDVHFRLRGLVSETSKYLQQDLTSQNSWVYVSCTGIPKTPGQIIDYAPNGTGMTWNEYYNVPTTAPFSTIEFDPITVDVVNLPVLTGGAGSTQAKHFSVTGSGHYLYTVQNYGRGYYDHPYGFDAGLDADGIQYGPQYSLDIGVPYGINYAKYPECIHDDVVRFKDQNGIATGCFNTLEIADGNLKVGTYRHMLFTGMINGDGADYATFYDAGGNGSVDWSSGIYAYQFYPSGDDSNLDSISGWAGNTAVLNNEETHKHYKSVVANHSPINMDNPLRFWDVRSGIFPASDADLEKAALSIKFNNEQSYEVLYSAGTSGLGFFSDAYSTGIRFNEGAYGNYNLLAPILDNAGTPTSLKTTLVEPSEIMERYLLVNSGDPLHSDVDTPDFPQVTNDPNNVTTKAIKSIKFQLSFEK